MNDALESRVDRIEKRLRRNRRFAVFFIAIGVCAVIKRCKDTKREKA